MGHGTNAIPFESPKPDAIRAGEALVVHGATGGVGLACAQLGKLLGARVIATGSDDAKLAVVGQLGADAS